MVRLDTLRALHDHEHRLAAYCPTCERWAVLDLERLIAEGRMTEHGLREVDAAKADGRWDKAYRIKDAQMPADLQAAIDAEPAASAMLARLTAQNRFALIFRTNTMKTEAGRAKKIADLVAMLKRGETPHPQKR